MNLFWHRCKSVQSGLFILYQQAITSSTTSNTYLRENVIDHLNSTFTLKARNIAERSNALKRAKIYRIVSESRCASRFCILGCRDDAEGDIVDGKWGAFLHAF